MFAFVRDRHVEAGEIIPLQQLLPRQQFSSLQRVSNEELVSLSSQDRDEMTDRTQSNPHDSWKIGIRCKSLCEAESHIKPSRPGCPGKIPSLCAAAVGMRFGCQFGFRGVLTKMLQNRCRRGGPTSRRRALKTNAILPLISQHSFWDRSNERFQDRSDRKRRDTQ